MRHMHAVNAAQDIDIWNVLYIHLWLWVKVKIKILIELNFTANISTYQIYKKNIQKR